MLVPDICILILSIIILYLIFKNNTQDGFTIGGTLGNDDITITFDPTTGNCTTKTMKDKDENGRFASTCTKYQQNCGINTTTDPDKFYQDVLKKTKELNTKYPTTLHPDIVKKEEVEAHMADINDQEAIDSQTLNTLNNVYT